MPDEVDLPNWVIRRWVVVKDGKVDRFETLPEARAHRLRLLPGRWQEVGQGSAVSDPYNVEWHM